MQSSPDLQLFCLLIHCLLGFRHLSLVGLDQRLQFGCRQRLQACELLERFCAAIIQAGDRAAGCYIRFWICQTALQLKCNGLAGGALPAIFEDSIINPIAVSASFLLEAFIAFSLAKNEVVYLRSTQTRYSRSERQGKHTDPLVISSFPFL